MTLPDCQRSEDDSTSVDVVILSWNRWKETHAAIESALDQEGVELRVHVVDQGSDAEQVAELERRIPTSGGCVNLVKLKRNLGVPGGRNFGASLGTGELIVFLDNDAVFASKECCARALQLIRQDPNLGAVAFHILNAFTNKTDLTSWNHAQDPTIFASKTFFTSRFSGGGCAVRRESFEACGGFDPVLQFMEEEKDLAYRIIDKGYLISHTPDIAVLHGISPEKRINWKDGRIYYLCRNMLYLDIKYRISLTRNILTFMDAMRIARRKGHLLRGGFGAAAGTALGIRSLIGGGGWSTPLSEKTWQYIEQNETRHYR
jgi:GT2 family glycosyltransferase